eukprot:1510325-Pleurochrysis_carterae.AAC.1
MGGKVRRITKGGAGLCEGCGGRDSKRRLGEGIPGNGGGLHMPSQGMRVSAACTITFNTI